MSAPSELFVANEADGAIAETPTIDEVIAEALSSGQLTHFQAQPFNYPHRWIDLGDRARGRFYLLEVGGWWYPKDLERVVESETARSRDDGVLAADETLTVANAYELAAYGAQVWNGSGKVLAYGSSFVDEVDDQLVPCLEKEGVRRKLCLKWRDAAWSRLDLALCVIT